MAKLYELINEIENFSFDIDEETGEIYNLADLDKLELERDTKIENLCLWIKNLKADAVAYKAEKESFTQKQKQAENKAESLSKYIQNILSGQKFKTDKVIVSYRKSEAVELEELVEIPNEFYKPQPPKLDKAELKKALKAGATFNGVHLVERQNMSIK